MRNYKHKLLCPFLRKLLSVEIMKNRHAKLLLEDNSKLLVLSDKNEAY